MKVVNPYIVGNPIKDQSVFFGRQDVFRDVMQILRQPGSNAIVLYGQRRIGKTSVLLQLEKQLRQAGEFTPVYFDLQDKAARPLAEVLYELAQHIARVTGHPAPRSTDFDRTGEYFRHVFLPEVTVSVASGGLVLLFDEFDVLDSPMRTKDSASESFFPYLQHWMDDIQKIKFVFVIGRRPEDLSVRTMATFKGIQSTRVSFLTQKDAFDVVLQSEKTGSLLWEKGAAERVIELTHGHPYFTQLLSSVIWENAHEDEPVETPRVTTGDVEEAVVHSLKFGANAFNWIWDGLPPAERVVVAAMAEVPEELITQDKLIEALNSSGVRLVARELEVAPETLIDWEVLIASEGAYRFAVPLLRRWVIINRPLRRVREELDRLNPLAENLYQSGQGFYGNNQLDPAEQQLRQALNINPNHLKARLLLGQVLLEKKNFSDSVDILDAAYQYDERSARADLIKALLALAETQEENLQLSTYERILTIQSDQASAKEKVRSIWVKRGESLLAQENFEEALKAFEQIDDLQRVEKVRQLMHEKKLTLDMQRADSYERAGQWELALQTLGQLTSEYPESETLLARLESARMHWHVESLGELKAAEATEDWNKVLGLCEALERNFPDDPVIGSSAERARAQIGAIRKYQEALTTLQSGQNDQARQILAEVLAENPKHLRAAQKLIEATYGEVKITRPTSSRVWLAVAFISFLWFMFGALAVGGLVWTQFAIPVLARGTVQEPVTVYLEWVLISAILVLAPVSLGITLYAGRVLETAFQVDVKAHPTFWRAFWTHFPFGMGLFYVDPVARRKWVYPFAAILTYILLLVGPALLAKPIETMMEHNPDLFYYYSPREAFSRGRVLLASGENEGLANVLTLALALAGGIYVLSFVDVFYRCWARVRHADLQKNGQSLILDGTPQRLLGLLKRSDAAESFTQRKPDRRTNAHYVYVVLDHGIPLYPALPGSPNTAIWLLKGTRLSIIERVEDALSKIGKYGNHIEVMDSQGNRGFVVAAAVSVNFPSDEKASGVAAQPEEQVMS